MINYSLNDRFPMYSIFFYFLLIAAGLVLNTFPCKMRNALDNNLYLKHFIGYLTMAFLVVITEPILNKKLTNVIFLSFALYIVFILVSKTEYGFFLSIIILLGLTYLLIIKKEEYKQDNEKNTQSASENDKKINIIVNINNFILIVTIALIIIGVLIYMGRKKYEYKDKFSYLTFFLGKIDCKYSKPKIGYLNSLKHLF